MNVQRYGKGRGAPWADRHPRRRADRRPKLPGATVTRATEFELKLQFALADRAALDSIEPLRSVQGEAHHLVSTYFDTARGDLRRAGYSLRVRRDGRTRLQTLKADGSASAGLFARGEWERRIRGDTPSLDLASGPLAGLAGLARASLDPVFVTDVQRTAYPLVGAEGRIEVAVDTGEIRAGERAEPIHEIEFELRGGGPASLFDVAREVNERVPLRLCVRSKAERGEALARGVPVGPFNAEPIALDPDGEAGDAFCAIARACIRQFRLNEDVMLEHGGAEPLHQARVGLRRLRSAFAIFKPLFEGDRRFPLLAAELRWLAGELGEVRNIDVLIPRLEGGSRDRLVLERERAFARICPELGSSRTRLLMIDLAEWLEFGAWRTAPVVPARLHQGATAFARDVLDSRHARLRHDGRRLAEHGPKRRHRVRIEAKKLRYAAEFFASLYPGGNRRREHAAFVERLGALQDVLGELNDRIVGPAVLAKLGIDTALPGAGKRAGERLAEKAERALKALMRRDRFWRI